METNILNAFSFNFKNIIIDEIALDGLEGIGLDLLWKRLENRISSKVTPKMKIRFWNYIVNNESISFYHLMESLPELEVLDRFKIIYEPSGQLLDPYEFVDGPYTYCPIENEYGSCSNYDTRSLIGKKDICPLSYEDIETTFGNKLVMVASLEERWKALTLHMPMTYLSMLTPIHYCILELVGKGRENGQMTVGKTNLSKIVGESKLLFYNRQHLQKLNLIKVLYTTQVTASKSMKSILLRLTRFHKPALQSLPKIGRVHDIVEYLLEKPDFSERNDIMIKKNYMNPVQSKKYQKTFNIFRFEDRDVKVNESTRSDKQKLYIKKRFIQLNPLSDDDSNSDEDNDVPPLKCEYKIGVNLLRQAYERFLDAGLQGLTQIEIAQLLGVEFYTSRTICRTFKAKNIVKEFLEDKGRQRTARYVAIAATKEMDEKYEEEKKKFFEYLNSSQKSNEKEKKRNNTDKIDSECGIPKKKAKLKRRDEKKGNDENLNCFITESECIDGLENTAHESLIYAKKHPTLRQLKFANGVLKVVNDKQFVIGFQALSSLVSKETGEPPMDTKALKTFIQRLIVDGQLKILKMKWPNIVNKCSYLICNPNVKTTDPIIKSKYKDICTKSKMKKAQVRKKWEPITRPLTQFSYPRYMKIQKLHELVVKIVLFDKIKMESIPPGFATIFSIIPEMTVEFALGNICYVEVSDIANLKLNEQLLGTKMKDAPQYISKIILQSKGFQNSIRVGIKVLAVMGLLQIIEKPSEVFAHHSSLLSCVFYVNRRAKILDTSGKWPREEDLKSLEKSFQFETYDVVKDYWNEISNISSNTNIILKKRDRYNLNYPLRSEYNVEQFDTGERFGDGLGPCGFDCTIYMDMPRLWKTFMARAARPEIKKPVKVKPKRKKKHVLEKTKNIKLITNTVKTEESFQIPKSRRRLKEKIEPQVHWSNLEDKIIIMCKAAIAILSPVSQPGCFKIRNTVARDLLNLFDPLKTAGVCHRRAQQLDSNSHLTHEKDCLLHELKRHRHLVENYEGVLKTLKARNPGNIYKVVEEAKLPMLELIGLFAQIHKKNLCVQQIPCIAMDIDDFNKHYTITRSSTNRSLNLYKTPSSSEMEFAALKEGIILSIMLSDHEMNTGTAKKIYSVFKIYSETVLRSAIDQLRKAGAISAREKTFNNNFNKVNFDDIIQSAYKISASYRRKWVNRLRSEFIDDLSNLLDSEVPQTGLKGRSDLNCLFFEMSCCDVLDIVSDTVPIVTGFAGSILQEEQMNVIDIETKYKLKSGLLGWKNNRNMRMFSELFKKFDHKKVFAELSKASVMTLKNNKDIDRKNEIISFVENKEFSGCTFKELQEQFPLDRNVLSDQLSQLEASGAVKRIGYFDNKIMLAKFTKPLLLQVNTEFFLLPSPWLNLQGEIHQDIFLNWTNVIMNKIFECPGYSLANLSDSFECISTKSVQDVCMFLEKCECVVLKCMESSEVDLFSDDDNVTEFIDFSPYESPENIFVFPVKDCLTKYAFIRKNIMLSES